MMFFSRKKKIQHDINSGLVFRWRGGYSANTGGLTIAIIMATTIFALAILGIKVYVSSASPPTRYRAQVIHVGDVDPSLRWMLERNSPFLRAWNRDQDELGSVSVRRKMHAAIDANRVQTMAWRKTELVEQQPTIPTIYPKAEVVLPKLARPQSGQNSKPNQIKDPKNIEWQYVIHSEVKGMAARLPKRRGYALNFRPLSEYLGRTVQFSVNIDALGNVVSSLPLKWNTDHEMKLIENWVNTIQFLPAKDPKAGISTIILNVSILERKRDR